MFAKTDHADWVVNKRRADDEPHSRIPRAESLQSDEIFTVCYREVSIAGDSDHSLTILTVRRIFERPTCWERPMFSGLALLTRVPRATSAKTSQLTQAGVRRGFAKAFLARTAKQDEIDEKR